MAEEQPGEAPAEGGRERRQTVGGHKIGATGLDFEVEGAPSSGRWVAARYVGAETDVAIQYTF